MMDLGVFLSVLVGFLTVVVTILAFMVAYIVYLHWKTGNEYEEDIRKKRDEIKREFESSIRLSPKFGKISSRLSLSLQYSQRMRTATDSGPIDNFAPVIRPALDGVINAILKIGPGKLKYGKEEFKAFRSETLDIKLNLEIANSNFPDRVQDLIEKCDKILELIGKLSFD